jgi:hypothetical protein
VSALAAWATQSIQDTIESVLSQTSARQAEAFDNEPDPFNGEGAENPAESGAGDRCWGEEVRAREAGRNSKNAEEACFARQKPYWPLLLVGLDLPACDQTDDSGASREADEAQQAYEDCLQGS